MPLFSSRRERRLWLWTLAAVVAIYSTLGLAGKLSAVLRARGVLDQTFFVAFLVTIAAVLGSGWVRRSGPQELWVALGVLAAYVTVVLRMGIGPEERTHLFEYGLVAALIHQALVERRRQGRGVRWPPFVAWVAAVALGWIDEGIQALLPARVYDIRDVGFNALAASMAILASVALGWARRFRSRAG